MAYINLTRKANNSCKKSKSYFASEIDVKDTDVGLVSVNLLLGNLPPNAIVTDAYVHRVVASNAATTATVALGTVEAGAQIMAAADIKGTGKVGSLVGQILTGSGKPLYAALTITGVQTAGKFYVVVEYLEPNKVTGELTKVT
jgi:hypothetical protein